MNIFWKTVFNDLKVALMMTETDAQGHSEDPACIYFMECKNGKSNISTLIYYFI